MARLTAKEYYAPRDELFKQACINGDTIDAEVIQCYIQTHNPKETGFGEVTEDTLNRQEIDKYYIVRFSDIEDGFRFWSYIPFSATYNENFISQEPERIMPF